MVTVVLMALNFLSAVGVVIVNKELFSRGGGVRFATFLTGLHFLATAVGIRACHAVGMYEIKHLKQTQARASIHMASAFAVFYSIRITSSINASRHQDVQYRALESQLVSYWYDIDSRVKTPKRVV